MPILPPPSTKLYAGATIHTLVLAYAGATLPLLLVLHASGLGTYPAINLQGVAEPVIATIVGCCGLIPAIPLTTALAAAFVSRIPVTDLAGAHGHSR